MPIGTGIAIIAVILLSLAITGIVSRGVQPGPGQSRRTPRDYRSQQRYSDVKVAWKSVAEQRASKRRASALEAIAAVWQPRIDAANKKANRASNRAMRTDSARAKRTASKYTNKAAEHAGHMKRELTFIQRAWDAAAGGDFKAQKLFGGVHPRTGHTTGGIGRAGHKPAHHQPASRKPKGKR